MGKFLNLIYDSDLLREYYIDLMNNYKIDDYILCKLNSIKDKPNEKFYYIYKTLYNKGYEKFEIHMLPAGSPILYLAS